LKNGEWEDRPDSWHIIQCAGTICMVTAEVRKEVESWLKTLKYPDDQYAYIVVDSILGEEITIMADAINVMYDTTPEKRGKSRSMDELMKTERLEQGFPEE
jgi:hypothetical protein